MCASVVELGGLSSLGHETPELIRDTVCCHAPCHSSILRKQYVIYFVLLSSCSVLYITQQKIFFSPTRYISLECCMHLIRSLTELSTFLWLSLVGYDDIHFICWERTDGQHWQRNVTPNANIAPCCFCVLRLFWLFLLFPSALKERTPHWRMMTISWFYFLFLLARNPTDLCMNVHRFEAVCWANTSSFNTAVCLNL